MVSKITVDALNPTDRQYIEIEAMTFNRASEGQAMDRQQAAAKALDIMISSDIDLTWSDAADVVRQYDDRYV
jgi:hypothetical protein